MYDPWVLGVKLATTSNINLEGLLVIDNIQTETNDRILVKNQINKYENGIYLSKLGSWIRSDDLNSSNDFKNGFKQFINKAIPLTLLTAVLSILGLYLLSNNYSFESSILKIIFIGLASLTFPHILLEYFLEKNEK